MTSFPHIPDAIDVGFVGGEIFGEYNCVFSFDTKFLYCPSGNVIKVYNVATGRYCGQLEGHKDRVTSLLMNERNHLQLISASLDGYVVIWDIGTDYSPIKMVDMQRPIYKVGQLKCYANSYLVVLNDNESGRYFIADSNALSSIVGQNKEMMLLHFGQFDAKSVSFSFETNIVAAIDSARKLVIWCADLSRFVNIAAPTFQMSFSGIAAHPTDRNVVAASTSSGRIYLWMKLFAMNDASANVPSFYLHWHSNCLRSLSFSPEGTFLFSAGEECVFVKWLWRKQQRSFIPRLGAPVRSIALSPDGAVYALGLSDNTIALVSSNMTQLRSIRSFITGRNIPAVRPQEDNNSISSSLTPVGLVYDHKLRAIVANSRPGHLQFFDAENNRNILLLDVAAENYVSGGPKLLPVTEVLKADVSGDGNWLCTVQSRGDVEHECTLKIWQFDEKSKTFCINTLSSRAHLGVVTTLRFSPQPDSRSENFRLVTASLDGFFRLWQCHKRQLADSAASQQQLSQYYWLNVFSSSYYSFPIFDADWSADGSLVALAANAYILLVDGRVDDFKDTDTNKTEIGLCLEISQTANDHWLLSTLTADGSSRITNLKFGQQEDSSYIVGCSYDNEGFICVWNLSTLQMTWRGSFLLPFIVSNPSSSCMVVFSGAAMQQKKLMIFKPSAPSTGYSYDFALPSACSDALSSQISPITSAVVLRKSQQMQNDSFFAQSDIYILTGDQKLYTISFSNANEKAAASSETTSESVKNSFRFSSPSITSTSTFPPSALASLLSLGQLSLQEKSAASHSDMLNSNASVQDMNLSTKFDPLFETPPHLLPPVSRIAPEFLLRRRAELCGINADFLRNSSDKLLSKIAVSSGDASMAVDDQTLAKSLLLDYKTNTRSALDWIREVL